MKTLDARIDALKPGQSIEISRSGGITCLAERTRDGKKVRFIRQTATGFTVFKVASF